ncbi:MAG TPA: hypothetical protein VF520_13400 [Thermoleophilaceae bacterium]
MSDADTELQRREALGWGLACPRIDPSGRTADPLGRDLVLAGGAGRPRELAEASGLENLAQSLEMALTSLLGADPFDVGFGMDGLSALAEETDPVLSRERVRMTVIDVVRRDPRVRRIIDLQVGDEAGSTVPGDPDADAEERSRLLRRGTLSVRVTFELITADRVSLDLAGGLPVG